MEVFSLAQGPVKSFRWATYLRISVILILSFYIVVAGQILPLAKLINYPGFYIAVTFSFLLIFAIVYLVKWLNKKLDQKYAWRAVPLKRLIYQVAICYLLILVIIYAVIRCYFIALQGDFKASGYMNTEFQIVNWMLLALNFKLVIVEMWPTYFQKEIFTGGSYLREIECTLSTKRVFLPMSEVACFKREGNLGAVWSKKNEKYHITYNMEQLNQQVDPRLFIQISRSEMVAYAAIKGYDSKLAKVDFKQLLDNEVTGKISEGRLKKFILGYEKYRKLKAINADNLS